MKVTGIVIHHSSCSSINGKGYDFFVTKAGIVVPGVEPADPGGNIHICIEGNFAERKREAPLSAEAEEQLFIAAKLIDKLAESFHLGPDLLRPHHEGCPGLGFPWLKLVISASDGYH